MSHVVHNLPFVAWGGLVGWLLAKAHRGWVVNLQRRRIQSLLTRNARLLRPRGAAVLDRSPDATGPAST